MCVAGKVAVGPLAPLLWWHLLARAHGGQHGGHCEYPRRVEECVKAKCIARFLSWLQE